LNKRKEKKLNTEWKDKKIQDRYKKGKELTIKDSRVTILLAKIGFKNSHLPVK